MRRRKASETVRDEVGPRPELARFFEEAVAFYLRLRRSAAMIHRRGDLSGPRQTVLRALARSGAQTVAHLAGARGESRQRFQPLVNALIREGLLQRVENPAHRRSALIALTRKGEATVLQAMKKEGSLRAQLSLDVTPAELTKATSVLRRVRHSLEHPETIRMLERGKATRSAEN